MERGVNIGSLMTPVAGLSPDIVWPRRNTVLIDYLPVGVFKAYFLPGAAYLGMIIGQSYQVSSLSSCGCNLSRDEKLA